MLLPTTLLEGKGGKRKTDFVNSSTIVLRQCVSEDPMLLESTHHTQRTVNETRN
jgi:hypothetical protein